jgi:hypothetical protein
MPKLDKVFTFLKLTKKQKYQFFRDPESQNT